MGFDFGRAVLGVGTGGTSELANLATGGGLFGGRNGPPKPPDLSKPGTPDEVKALQARLDAIQGPKQLTGEGDNAYVAKNIDGPLPEYDYARKKAAESISVAKANNADALARRFAALGGGTNSGSFIKQAELQNQSADKQLGDAMEGIGAQEAQAKRALAQNEENKAYQSGEALKGRNFQREQYNAQSDWAAKVFQFDSSSKLAQLDLGWQNAELERRMNQYNAELSAYQAQHQGGLLGAGGFLGTGIGA